MNIIDNFYLSSCNFTGNIQSLKERSLSRFHTSRSSRNNNITWCNNSNFSRCCYFKFTNNFFYRLEIVFAKNKTNISSNVREKSFKGFVVFNVSSNGLSDHSLHNIYKNTKIQLIHTHIFTHEKNTLSS